MLFRRCPDSSSPPNAPTADALLARQPGAVVDAALAAALPTASIREHEAMVSRLLGRRSAVVGLALVEHLHRLEPRAAQRVRDAADHGLDAAVRRAFGSGTDATRNALRLIGERRLGHLAYLVVEATGLARRDLAEEAAAVLVHLAAEAPAGSAEAASVAAAVDPALAARDPREGEHAGRTALHTSFLLLAGERFPLTLAGLASEDHPALAPLRRRLAAADGAAERGALLPLLQTETLRDAVITGLGVAARERPLRGVFPEPALLHDPAVRAALARIADPAAVCPRGWPADAADAERQAWVWMLGCLRLPPAALGRWLALALADPAPGVRVAALGLAASSAGSGATLGPACAEASAAAGTPAEARLAARLALRGEPRSSVVEGLGQSRHAAVRAAATAAMATAAAEALFANWDRATGPARVAALRRCLGLPGGETALRARLVPRQHAAPADRRRRGGVRALLRAERDRRSTQVEAEGDAAAAPNPDEALEAVLDRLDPGERGGSEAAA